MRNCDSKRLLSRDVIDCCSCFSGSVYMASVVFCDDHILITSDGNLPIVDVDENFVSQTLNDDLYWLMKVE